MHLLGLVRRIPSFPSLQPIFILTLCLTSSIAFLNLACDTGYSEVVGEWPIQRIKVSKDSLTIILEPTVVLGTVINMADFGGVEPGMPVDEVERIAGKPPLAERRFDSPAFSFALAGGSVSLVKRTVESEGPATEKWELYAFPENRKLEELLSEMVLRQLHGNAEIERIAVVGGAKQGLVSFTVKDDKVLYIYWGRSSGRSRPDGAKLPEEHRSAS